MLRYHEFEPVPVATTRPEHLYLQLGLPSMPISKYETRAEMLSPMNTSFRARDGRTTTSSSPASEELTDLTAVRSQTLWRSLLSLISCSCSVNLCSIDAGVWSFNKMGVGKGAPLSLVIASRILFLISQLKFPDISLSMPRSKVLVYRLGKQR